MSAGHTVLSSTSGDEYLSAVCLINFVASVWSTTTDYGH